MKNFSRILLIAAMSVLAVAANAQFRFGPQVGLNVASVKWLDSEGNENSMLDSRVGYNIGMIGEYQLSELISLQSGLSLSSKGADMSIGMDEFGSMEGKLAPLYLDVPVNAVFNYNTGNVKLFGLVGPYVAFGIGGKSEMKKSELDWETGEMVTTTENEDVKFGDTDEDDFTSTDFGLNIGGGIEVKNIRFTTQYGLGLKNVMPNPSGDASIKNRVLSFSVAYMFGGK